MKRGHARTARGAGRRCRNQQPAAGPRTYHLIDLENHLGDTAWDAAAVAHVARAYSDLTQPGPGDLMFVVVGRKLAFAAKQAFPGAEVKVADGPDAADLKLIHHEQISWLADRFDRVVVASGDYLFAGLLASLRLAGVDTVVAARAKSLSHYSRAEAGTVLTLPEPPLLDLTDEAAWERPTLAHLT